MNEKKIFGVPVDGQNEHYFKRDELLFIQNCKKNSKLNIPVFYTKKGRFTVCTSLESAKATMPTFERFQRWNLVNKLAVSQIDCTEFGYVVCFKETDITTDISVKKYKNLDLHCPNNEDRFLVVTKDSFVQWLPLEEICYIDFPESKKEARILRFHTKDDILLTDMTLGRHSKILKLIRMDSGIYANLDNTKHIELLPYGGIVHFVCSDYTTTISRQKVKLFQEIIPIIDNNQQTISSERRATAN